VKILSTVPGNKYQDTIINLGSVVVTWDGTSMATPHVAGAAAAVWSTDPSDDFFNNCKKAGGIIHENRCSFGKSILWWQT